MLCIAVINESSGKCRLFTGWGPAKKTEEPRQCLNTMWRQNIIY